MTASRSSPFSTNPAHSTCDEAPEETKRPPSITESSMDYDIQTTMRPKLPPTPPFEDSHLSYPPSSPEEDITMPSSPLATGLELLMAERDGLAHLHHVYSTSPLAQKGFESAVDVLTSTTQRHGRVMISGVGKSGLIGRKMVATMNSLGIRAGWMHPTEALHGDLGMVGPHDALILITFSGTTSELLSLMGHLPASCPVILMTSALPTDRQVPSDLPLFAARINAVHYNNVLLPTPVPVAEKVLFGVSAPTVSTTVTLALGDALAMAAARKLHEHADGVKDVFHKYHPGGAIGKASVVEKQQASPPPNPSDEPPGSASPISLAGSTVGDMTDSEPDLSLELESASTSLSTRDAEMGKFGRLPKEEFDVSEAPAKQVF